MMSKLRINPVYNAVLMLIGTVVSLYASFTLVVDALILAYTPAMELGCDISSRISCTSVAKSKYASFLTISQAPIPNALFGALFFSAFMGLTVALILGFNPPKWFKWLIGVGVGACALFALYLLTVSVFILKVLCPYCIMMDFGVTLLIVGYIRWFSSLRKESNFRFLAHWSTILVEAIPFILLTFVVISHIL